MLVGKKCRQNSIATIIFVSSNVFRLVDQDVYLSQFSFRLQCFGVALLAVAALLTDPTLCKQPQNYHFGQIFGCLQNVGSVNNAATVNSTTPKHCSLQLNYRIVASRSTCYYEILGNQKFCFLKSRLLTCPKFFLGTKLFCFLRFCESSQNFSSFGQLLFFGAHVTI